MTVEDMPMVRWFVGMEWRTVAASAASTLVVLVAGMACQRGNKPAPAGAAPELGFRSPAAGDTLIEGHTYTIRWTSPPGMRINLGARMGGHDKGHLLINAPAGLDSLVWTVPSGFVTGFGPPSAEVWLRLENADSSLQWVEAGPLVVTGASRSN